MGEEELVLMRFVSTFRNLPKSCLAACGIARDLPWALGDWSQEPGARQGHEPLCLVSLTWRD